MPFSCKHLSRSKLKYKQRWNKNSECQKLLGIDFDSELRFDQHITDLCWRTS